MTAILDRIIELLLGAWATLVPWVIVGDDQCGVIRRLGKYKRDTRAGWNWKIPVLERPLLTSAALESEVLREQTLTTRDGVSMTVRPAISYRVTNPRKYILECGSVIGVINDVGGTVVARVLPRFTSDEVLHSAEFNAKLFQRVRLRAARWGIKVESFGLVERVKARTYRLITSASGSGSGHDSV